MPNLTIVHKPPLLASITDDELNELIQCPKDITNHARKNMLVENGSERNDMVVISAKGYYTEPQSFRIFIRRSILLPEDFSIGLIWMPTGHTGIILLRYNGRHGLNRSVEHQRVPHIHRLMAADIQAEKYDPHQAIETDEYHTLEEALPLFLKACHIINGEKDFPWIREMNLFENM